MIEVTVLNYLLAAGLSVGQHVYCEVPEVPPDEYILIDRTGGGEQNHILTATLAIQSISRLSRLRAMTINEEVKTEMKDLMYVADIFRCKLNSDYDYTNPTTNEYRYQAVFDLFY